MSNSNLSGQDRAELDALKARIEVLEQHAGIEVEKPDEPEPEMTVEEYQAEVRRLREERDRARVEANPAPATDLGYTPIGTRQATDAHPI